MARRLRHQDYSIAWVCALPIELAAAQQMLDEEHEDLERYEGDTDDNLYSLGSIAGHNVVIVCLPAGRIGTNPAAVLVTQTRASFKGIRVALMIGIGGGVPSAENDVRLGDIVVSQPTQTFNGVVQYDHGKATPTRFERTGSLGPPPKVLLAAVAKVRANRIRGKSKFEENMSLFDGISTFHRQRTGPDVLYEASYEHQSEQSCDQCDNSRRVFRQPRNDGEEVVIHYGTIASGNQVIRDARIRDELSKELGGVLCFEMEAAGLYSNLPCLVIRGICDYADSHKNKKWQAFAAANAAAYAREILSTLPHTKVTGSDIVETATNSPSENKPIYCIPFLRNQYFVGREAELDVLKQRLLVSQDCQRISIVGLGGAGKTQLALQFAYTVKTTLSDCSIFWLSALSLESFEQSCVEIARAMHLTQSDGVDVKEQVKQHLSTSRAGRWLLIVDNVDDSEMLFGSQPKGIIDYLPGSEQGITIYTTRTFRVAHALTRANIIEVGAMHPRDATRFLEDSLFQEKDNRNDEAARELLENLAYLPLAIAQAAAYMNVNRLSLEEYLQIMKNTERGMINLMSREFQDDSRYMDSVATTWVISFNQILATNVMAVDLLKIIACLEWKAIPESILPQAESVEQMTNALGTLCAYSFLKRRNGEKTYDLHRLVHLATRIWINRHDTLMAEEERAMRHIASIFPWGTYEERMIWKAYFPHVIRLLENRHNHDSDSVALLTCKVGHCLSYDGKTKDAIMWLEETVERRQHLGEEDSGLLDTQRSLAAMYTNDGQTGKAARLLERVLAVCQRVLHEEHPILLGAQFELASVYTADRQDKNAIKLLEHVSSIREKSLGNENAHYLKTQHALGLAYSANNQARKAIEVLERVIAGEQKTLDSEHPNLLASKHVLAGAYAKDGQLSKSIRILEDVVACEQRVLGSEHPRLLDSQNGLALSYSDDGQQKKAVELLEKAIGCQQQIQDKEHPGLLAAQLTLAVIYTRDNHIEKGIDLLKYVVAIQEKLFDENHPTRLGSRRVLAELLKEQAEKETDVHADSKEWHIV